jgi:RsiW-degrading membrane proteinase PrsW (M82 family)
MYSLTVWILLIVISFLPPLIYTTWIRNTERCHRQQWVSIAVCFLWGAGIATFASLILEVGLGIPLSISIQNENKLLLISAIVLAPIVEEFTKPLVLRTSIVKKGISELEDGFIYGAVAGLGFSATENLLYGVGYYSEGLAAFLILMGIRSVGGCLLHATATSLTGYGYGKKILMQSSWVRVIPYFVFAIIIHSSYNFLVSFELLGATSGLFIALLFVIFGISVVRRKIEDLDRKNC